MNDIELSLLRHELPAAETAAYLNAGTFGPIPRATQAAIADELGNEFWRGRIGSAAYARYQQRANEARAAFAEVLSSTPERIALTHSTTGAVNLALGGLRWNEGDEIISTDGEHPGLDEPLDELARRYGVVVRRAEVLFAADTLGPIEALITPRTRLIALSHVLWGSGQILPIARISAAARAQGALLLVDGAQSVGAIALDPAADGVDLYTASGQKWLLGPAGTGALWVREGLDDQLGLAQPGYLARDIRSPGKPLWPGARRFDGASLAPSSLRGVAESVRFRREAIGWDAGFSRAVEMAERFRAVLAGLPRVRVDTPEGPLASLVTFEIDGVDAEAASAGLEQRGVLVRWIESPRRVRASVGFWTSDRDLAALCEAVSGLK